MESVEGSYVLFLETKALYLHMMWDGESLCIAKMFFFVCFFWVCRIFS